MGMSQDEYRRQRPAKDLVDPEASAQTKLRVMLRDVVTAEALTTDEHWNGYLEWLSGARNIAVANAEHYSRILTNSAVVSHDELIKAKIGVSNCEAVRESLEWCMELPRQLKEGATEVRELLKKISETEDEGAKK